VFDLRQVINLLLPIIFFSYDIYDFWFFVVKPDFASILAVFPADTRICWNTSRSKKDKSSPKLTFVKGSHMTLRRYILKRITQILPVVFVVVVLNFTLLHIAPSDPAAVIAGENASPDIIQAVRIKYGLDKPFYVQLGIYLWNLVHGDFGFSYAINRPVLPIILDRVPATVLLVGTGQLLAILFGSLLGAHSARKYSGKMDRLLSTLSLGLNSTPVFWLGLVFIMIFSIRLNLFPTFGMTSVIVEKQGLDYILDLIWHGFLPVTTLICFYFPTYFRIARASVVETMQEDFVTTFRAVGQKETTIFYKHVLRNALSPTVNLAALNAGAMLAGAIMVETVFGWPGMGLLIQQCIYFRDYNLLASIFFVVSVMIAIACLAADVINGFLDPRIKYG
jgi:peptide/nickel transport system permease protein